MMKNITSKLLAFIFGSFLLTFTSCTNDDGYSLGQFWIEVATIQPLENGSYYILLDDGTKLWPAAGEIVVPKYSRAQVNYTKISDKQGEYDHYVKVNYLQYISTKDIVRITPENNETLGNDTIKILEYWQGNDFLNIHFGFNAEDSRIKHSVDMGENRLMPQADVVNLELRHNANGDKAKYGVKGLIAFDLRPYQYEGRDSVNFVIKVNSFKNNVKEYKFTYKYKNTDAKNSKGHTFDPLDGGMYE